ncbi:hypothetical protein SASPL_131905 [Salvia splendens]|uniref:Cell wall hydroxyproline-rich glycoprotein n=1 Tax=Salvia splendens TaxID=180675 RepID=A0A8X8XA44_SALSN|nr:hypothetical protein SASPL_131905 [Salvia splendens]
METMNKKKEEFVNELENSVPDEEEEEEDANAATSHRDFGVKMVGLSKEFNHIKSKLVKGVRPDEFGVFSFVGMAGSGRSMIAKTIFEHIYNGREQSLDCGARVTIGPRYQRRETLLAILDQVMGPSSSEGYVLEGDDELLIEKVNSSLKGRKYMIVIDDIWETRVWDDLRRSFPEQSNGSLILITTSFEEVALYADCCRIFQIPVLDEDRTWDVLQIAIFGVGSSCSRQTEESGRMIARNCRGRMFSFAKVVLFMLKAEKNQKMQLQACWNAIAQDKEHPVFLIPDELLEVDKIGEDIQLLTRTILTHTTISRNSDRLKENKMNMQTAPLNYAVNAFGAQSNGSWQCSKSRSGSLTPVVCSSNSRTGAYIPKLEPFTRNKIDRAVREPPLIEKAENQIAGSDRYNFKPILDAKLDYCVTLEGDESYSCWQAYFELKDLEKESPKEEVERLIVEAGGVKSLISCVHGVAGIHKAKKECGELRKSTSAVKAEAYPCPIPDGLPKTSEELEEEEKARMPDSPFTRLLRARGRCAAWLKQARHAFEAWKQAIYSDPMNFTANWVGPDVCSYNGIVCAQALDDPSLTVVAGVDLNHADIAGHLPDEIGDLADLSLLHLNSNRFCGIIPKSIKKLKLLFELDVSNNRFVGPFPKVVLELPELKYLDLRFNDFEGELPKELFDKELDAIFMNNNRFRSSIPENLGNSPASVIVLSNNHLMGCIPQSIGKMAGYLDELVLSNNKLSGCMPEEVTLLNSTVVFDVSMNKFVGDLPEGMEYMQSLEVVNIARNEFRSNMPDTVCSLPNLKNLTYAHNYFDAKDASCDHGAIPEVTFVGEENCIAGEKEQRTEKVCHEALNEKTFIAVHA